MTDTLKTYEQTVFEEGEAKGREEGEAKGREEGREEGKTLGAVSARREDLRELLTERFGELPPELLERIDAVDDIEQLKSAFRQALHIGSVDELQL